MNRDAPATIESLEARLRDLGGTLPRRLKQCAEFLLRHPERVLVSTVAELGASMELPPSAMVRLCQAVGFTGYSEMQQLYRNAWSAQWPDYRSQIRDLRKTDHGVAALHAKLVEAESQSLQRNLQALDPEALEASITMLAQARVLHVAGLEHDFPTAGYALSLLERLEVPAMLHGAVGGSGTRHALLPGDALLAIAFAPYSPGTIELAAHAREIGMPVVAVTDGLDGTLREVGASVLSVAEIDLGAARTLSATLTLTLTLALAIGERRAEARPGGDRRQAARR
jgi:DNA-binding MurR/RpiR family transcriptional regulator